VNSTKKIFVGGFKAEQITVRAGRAPQPEFIFPPLAQAERDRQRCLALDPTHNLRDPLGGKQIVFTGLHHNRAVAELFGLTGAVENLFPRHAIARQGAIGLPQAAIHTLPHAVARYLDQSAQMHGIADVLPAHAIRPLV
jgi:hypothetical protein